MYKMPEAADLVYLFEERQFQFCQIVLKMHTYHTSGIQEDTADKDINYTMSQLRISTISSLSNVQTFTSDRHMLHN